MHIEHDMGHVIVVDRVKEHMKPRPTNGASKRLAKRWNHRLSEESLTQGESPLKDSAKTVSISTTIPLGTGRPASLFYPWQSMAMRGTEESRQSRTWNPLKTMSCTKGETAFDLSSALNYAEPSGWSQLVGFCRENTKIIHHPPYQDWDTTLTCGSTSAIEISLRMFCNRGDWMLAEASTYPGTLMASRAQGLNVQGIEMDGDGLVPEDLDDKLRNWDSSRGRRPFILYTIPSGQNPTGITQSTERKKAIYQIAERYDLLILEDDPYFFLRLDKIPALSDTPPWMSIPTKFQKSLHTSYLSLDKSGRVIRLESTSKILAPGLRCGWLTASKQIVDLFMDFVEVGPSAPSGPSQVMLYKLLVENWGQEGFVNWLDHLSGEYGMRRDSMVAACEKHLPNEVCTWTRPTHGMFIWITLDLNMHPIGAEKGAEQCQEVEDRISREAESNGVLVAKGSWFTVEGSSNKVFFRMTFVATVSEDDLERGVELFGRAVRAEFQI